VYRADGTCPAAVDARPGASVTTPLTGPPPGGSDDGGGAMATALAAYHAKGKGERLVLGVYVDNLQIVHSAQIDDESSKLYSFMKAIQSDWDVEDEGEMVDLLGIEIVHHPNGSITLHQGAYIHKLIKEFLPDGKPKGVKGNLPYSGLLDKRAADASHERAMNGGVCKHPNLVRPYQRRLGCLMYLANSTRPDIAYAVSMHCRNMSSPTPDLLTEIDWVFAYLERNAEVGLTYDATPCEAEGFNDASFEEGRSTSGYNIQWQGAAVSWASTKQASTALSTCEAEIYALSEGAKDLVYFRKLLTGLGETPSCPSRCATDNKAARDFAYNPEHHKHSKHIQRRHFYIRDMVEAMELVVPFVRTDDNISDMLTKQLDSCRFHLLRALMMNEPRRG